MCCLLILQCNKLYKQLAYLNFEITLNIYLLQQSVVFQLFLIYKGSIILYLLIKKLNYTIYFKYIWLSINL